MRRGIPAGDVIANGHNLKTLGDLARGVRTRYADFSDTSGLKKAFAGAEKLVLVSTTVPSKRLGHHQRAVDSGRMPGSRSPLTSACFVPTPPRPFLGATYREPEAYLRESGVPAVLLRNGWYLENYTDQLPIYSQNGVITGAGRQGRVSAASRVDYAEAAAAVADEGHAGAVYELGADEAFTLSRQAAATSIAVGVQISYRDLLAGELLEMY